MHSTPGSIKMAGGKIAELSVPFKGVTMPVNVYLMQPKTGEPFALCVCFEDAVIETRLEIGKNQSGEWIDLYDRNSELAEKIGPMIESKLKPRLYN